MHNTVAADFFTVEVVTPRALVTYYPFDCARDGGSGRVQGTLRCDQAMPG
jgi:hypothetical protein